jgi:hypothetical protein
VKYVAVIALIVATAFLCRAGAQNRPLINYTFDCKKLSPANQSQGCDSYNEMVVKADKDITDTFQSSSDVLVCFRPQEDTFLIVSYSVPDDDQYHPSSTVKNKLEAEDFLSFSRYKDGILDDSNSFFGTLVKFVNLTTFPASFRAKNNDGSSGSIDSSEVSYNSEFKNLNNTKTSYNIQIRLSTLRFSETYTAEDAVPPKAAKSPTPAAAPPQSRIGYTGYCAQFKPAT